MISDISAISYYLLHNLLYGGRTQSGKVRSGHYLKEGDLKVPAP